MLYVTIRYIKQVRYQVSLDGQCERENENYHAYLSSAKVKDSHYINYVSQFFFQKSSNFPLFRVNFCGFSNKNWLKIFHIMFGTKNN